MKERLLTLAGAALAFYLVYILLLPTPAPVEVQVSYPTTGDRGRHGLAGAWRWLQQAGVNTLSLRERYQALTADPALPRDGNLLIVSLPRRLPSRDWEEQQLLTWLQEGNTILVLAALSDWPQWATRGNTVSHTLRLLGLSLHSKEADDTQEADTTEDTEPGIKTETDLEAAEPRKLVPTFRHRLTRGLDHVRAEWKTTEGLGWSLEGAAEQRSLLVLLQDEQSGDPAMWLGRVGSGRMIISRHADLFGNVALGEGDNARLLTNLVENSLGEDGYVIFDDMHQGLSTLYDPEAFFDDRRLHHTLGFILLLWLVYLLGHTNRFQPLTYKPRRMQLVEHVRAIGNFLARRLQPATAARRMLLHFFNDIRRYHGLPRNGQPVWEKLAGYQQLDHRDLVQLKTYYQRAEAQQSVNLIKLDQLIKSIRKQLL